MPVRVRENLAGIEIWPEGEKWRWRVVRFTDRGTRIVAAGAAPSEAEARRAARWRAARAWVILSALTAAGAAAAALLLWLMR